MIGFALALAATSAPALAGNVLVVGPGPTQIAEIQAAVDAAVDGDVVLVKTGTYAGFVVPNKSLAIVADAGHSVSVDGAIRASNLSANRTLVIAGIRATGRLSSNWYEGHGLYLQGCAGHVRVQDCVLTALTNLCQLIDPNYGADVEACAAVSFVRCTLQGSIVHGNADAGSGLRAWNSSVALGDSSATGGTAYFQYCSFPDGGDGGSGANTWNTFVYAARSEFHGGNGANGDPWTGYPGDGGNGIVAGGPAGVAHLLEDTMTYGLGGSACSLSCAFGNDGWPTCCGAAIDIISGTARLLTASRVARESTTLALTVRGVVGDLVALRIGRTPAFAYDAAQSGVVLTASPIPSRYLVLGTIPAGGQMTASIPLGSLPPNEEGSTFFLQAAHVDASGRRWLGSPATLVVLDSAF